MTEANISNNSKKPIERKALGRGLAALFNETQAAGNPFPSGDNQPLSRHKRQETGAAKVNLQKIKANPDQPRKNFDESKLKELAESIREQGLIQPVVVSKQNDDTYIIIAGERRWRASQMAGLQEIPVYIRDNVHSETENDLASLVENIQREELNPLELAEAYDRLLQKKTLTQESLAKKLGVSRVAIANTLRLLKLPNDIRAYVIDGRIKEGHARTLLSLPNEKSMLEIAEEIVRDALSVRAVESRVRDLLNPPTQNIKVQLGDLSEEAKLMAATEKEISGKDPEIMALEEELRKIFGTKVQIKGNAGRGMIELFYAGSDSLNRLLHLLRSAG